MKKLKLLFLAPTIVAVSALSGCSGPQEDVRISFCKDLTWVKLSSPQELVWQEIRQEIRRPEYAKITLDYSVGTKAGHSVCVYDYATTDENVMTHADPLSAYATVPSGMTVNGRALSEKKLNELVANTAKLQSIKVADGILESITNFVDDLRDGLRQ